MSEITALENRVTRLENEIKAGFSELKQLMRQEVADLKDEQIKDLREANKRLADDQRRAWDAIESLRRREDQRTGGNKAISGITHFLSAGLGGVVTWIATLLSSGGRVPPH